MANGITWISYLKPKTTTIGPTFIGTSETITGYSESYEGESYISFPGYTGQRAAGGTSSLNFTSQTESESEQRNNVPSTRLGGATTYYETQVNGAGTFATLKIENSTITSRNSVGDFQGTGSSSGSTSAPFQTVNISTTTTSKVQGFLTDTTTRSVNMFAASTTIQGTLKTIFFTNKSLATQTGTFRSTEFTITTTTTDSTTHFKTYTSPTGDQRIVYDTVWLSVLNPLNSNLRLAVIASGISNPTTTGVHELNYLNQSEITLLWVPPISVEEVFVREAFFRTNRAGWFFYTETSAFTTTQSTFSTISYNQTVFEGTQNSYTVEDWVPFTTTVHTSNSSTVLSASLNTGYTEIDNYYDDDGNEFTRTITVVPQSWSAITLTSQRSGQRKTTTTKSVQSQSRNDDLTFTTSTNEIEVFNTFSTVSLTAGYEINYNAIPWTTHPGLGYSFALALDTDFSVFETTSLTSRYKLTFEKETRRVTDSETRLSSTKITGTWFRTFYIPLKNELQLEQSAFATHSPQNFNPRAAVADLSFNTTPNLTAAPFLFTMEGNEHVIARDYRESDLGEIRPGFFVPLIHPSFTTVLSSASSGGRLHPSVWSTMTVSREGDKFSSSWRFEKSKDENGTTFTTASGSCQAGTDWDFPLGVETRDSRTLGGAMQPNSNLVFFQTPGVIALTTYDNQNFGTEFSTQSAFTFSTITPSEITVRSTIPVLVGYGLTQYTLLDNGMP
jgi:hypothetical protein